MGVFKEGRSGPGCSGSSQSSIICRKHEKHDAGQTVLKVWSGPRLSATIDPVCPAPAPRSGFEQR